MKRLALALALALLASPVGAERLAQIVSSRNVQITSSFDGATLSLFGTIEADTPGVALTGPYNVIVIVTGPLQDRVARLKTNRLGIWTNTDQVQFKQFPSFYSVLSSGRLELIAEPTLLAEDSILPEDQARLAAQSVGLKGEMFGAELVRLMTQEGHFSLNEDGVHFLSDTAYMGQVTLPSDVANGPFIAHTLVLKDKQLVAEGSQGFSVRKTGFENFVFVAARQYPLLYGIVCVILALGTGWLAGVAFKR
ncbi:MAG: TIGR02186 family protein [Devosia nanyangense]|uniref:TIGR02186 family protein n=1 Tax=Devosia nanyangense TaxID=1228055 RepID=A0A933NY72_9HYPH|nr:TIGR02186 family protein [Devosia nanyangense]